MAADREDRPADAGRGPHGHRLGHVVRAAGQQLQLRLDVRRPRAVRQADEPRPERHGHHGPAAAAWAREIKDAQVIVFGAPADPGPRASPAASSSWSRTAAASGLPSLAEADRRADRASCKHEPGLIGVSTQFRSNTPQLYLDIDRTKVASLGVSLDDVNQTLQIYLGSLYVNSFNEFGRYWQVNHPGRRQVPQPGRGHQPAPGPQQRGQMVPLGTLVDVARDRRPGLRHALQPLHRRADHRQPAARASAPARPSTAIDRLADETLPLSMKTEWTELMFMQIQAGNTAHVRLRAWRWCSSSWPWRPCTRAGRCRWR